LSGDFWVFYLEYVPRNIARYLVYKGFGNFSITVYVKGVKGGRSPALPSVSLGVSQEKKEYPTNIA